MLIGPYQHTVPPADFPGATAIARTALVAIFSPQFGVAIFFVLSGFVLARSTLAKPAPFGELASRRYLRLTLPVVVSTVAIWLWLTTGFHPDAALAAQNHSEWLAMNFGWLSWTPNNLGIALYQATIDLYKSNHHWWNTSLWTLQIELWGSLALFAAYLLMVRLSVRPIWRLLVSLAFTIGLWHSMYAEFAAGAALFELTSRPSFHLKFPPWLRATSGALLLTMAILLGGTPEYNLPASPYLPILVRLSAITTDPALLMHRLGALFMVAAVLYWRPLATLFESLPFAFLGRISFMMYLCHVSLICACGAWLVLHLSHHLHYSLATLVALPFFLGLVFLVGECATRWVDIPCIKLARRAGHLFAANHKSGS